MTVVNDVFHAGEIAVQERAGERAIAEHYGSMIRDRLTDGARRFLERQGVIAVGGAAADGTLWASLWCGDAGFISTDVLGQRVTLHWPLAHIVADDPVRPLVASGEPLAMLVIDLAKRARLRINGVVHDVHGTGVQLTVGETFGNCIKYIQRRERMVTATPDEAPVVRRGTTIDADRREFVRRTDTLFVASIHRERGLDVSHRGGRPGFARVVDERTIRIPDYQGNSLFQTLGNIESDPRAAMALVDFDRRRVLSMTGVAAIEFTAEDSAQPTGGTDRYWSFTVDRWVEFSLPSTMRWTLIERSPFNP